VVSSAAAGALADASKLVGVVAVSQIVALIQSDQKKVRLSFVRFSRVLLPWSLTWRCMI
jgi:hypothetical protein